MKDIKEYKEIVRKTLALFIQDIRQLNQSIESQNQIVAKMFEIDNKGLVRLAEQASIFQQAQIKKFVDSFNEIMTRYEVLWVELKRETQKISSTTRRKILIKELYTVEEDLREELERLQANSQKLSPLISDEELREQLELIDQTSPQTMISIWTRLL